MAGNQCSQGKSCGASCIASKKACIVELTPQIGDLAKAISKRTAPESEYSDWPVLAEGYNGRVRISPDGTRVVKELLEKGGEKGEFGPHEVELATKMGELGHSPKIHKATDDFLEMDVAPGKPLWSDYQKGDDDPTMSGAQATQAAEAIKALHKLGFAHKDNHALQWIADGDNVKWVDFGLSRPLSEVGSVFALQDLSKISSLVNWDNPELDGNPYVSLVRQRLNEYREAKGQSKAAKARREEIANQYLADLEGLQ